VVRYGYEALDQQGRKVQGVIEAANEEKAIELLRGEGLYILGLNPLRPGAKESTFFAAPTSEDDFRRTRWISPGSALVKVSKGIAALALMAVFGATVVFTMSLPLYWEATYLEGDKGLLTNAKVTQRDPDSPQVEYEFEAAGELYRGQGRHEDNADGPFLAVGDAIEVLYSVEKPSIHRLYRGKRPDSAALRKPVAIALVVDLLALLVLFVAASWEHAYNISVSLRAGMPLPTGEAKKILSNALCIPLFPLIFVCVFLSRQSSLFAPYRFYLVGATFLLAAAAVLIHIYSPFRSTE